MHSTLNVSLQGGSQIGNKDKMLVSYCFLLKVIYAITQIDFAHSDPRAFS